MRAAAGPLSGLQLAKSPQPRQMVCTTTVGQPAGVVLDFLEFDTAGSITVC